VVALIATIITPSIISRHYSYPDLIVVVVVLDAVVIMISCVKGMQTACLGTLQFRKYYVNVNTI